MTRQVTSGILLPQDIMKSSKSLLFTCFLALLLLHPSMSRATVIQILHTNDLHASMQTAGAPAEGEQEYGGWAQVKAKMDELRAEAKAKGIDTIQLDAGDFTEGTIEYFPDRGSHILKTFQDMGYDATTVGNHDWLMGAVGMDTLYGLAPFPFPVLSANIEIDRRLKNLKSQIFPTTQIVKSGIKIGIMGLSTNEAFYSWIPKVGSKPNDFKIVPYADTKLENDEHSLDPKCSHIKMGIANTLLHDLRQKNDVVIAMTHIGFDEDKILAANSKDLDLIVGGHSHTFLESMNFTKDRNGKEIPIVQTGFNGQRIGKILLEYDPTQTPSVKVLTYELVEVLHNGPADPVIAADVAETEKAVSDLYGPHLDDTIGITEDRLISGDSGPTAYAQFAVDAMRATAKTDIAVDVGAFNGNTPQAAGSVSRRNLMMMYPRKFEAEQNQGLYVYQARIPGLAVKIGLQYSLKFGNYVAMSGVTYDVKKLSAEAYAALKQKYAGTANADAVTPYYAENIKIKNKDVQDFEYYTVATPESLARGAYGITELMKLILIDAKPTSQTIWDSTSTYLTKIGTILAAIPNPVFQSVREIPMYNSAGSVPDMVNEAVNEIVKELGDRVTPSP